MSDPKSLKRLVSHIFAGAKDEVLHKQAADILRQDPQSILSAALQLKPAGYNPVPGEPVPDIRTVPVAERTLARGPEPDFVWRDCIGRRTVHPLRYFKPATLAELVAIVKDATERGVRVKGIGSGHSFSDVDDAPGYMVDTHALCQVLPLDPG